MAEIEITAKALFIFDTDEYAIEVAEVFGPDYSIEEYAAYCKDVVWDLLADPFSLEYSVTTRVLDTDATDVVG